MPKSECLLAAYLQVPGLILKIFHTHTEFSLTPILDYFTPTFFILTPTFSKAPIEKYGKTPNFSSRQHFYSYFQNPSENSDTHTLDVTLLNMVKVGTYIIIWSGSVGV